MPFPVFFVFIDKFPYSSVFFFKEYGLRGKKQAEDKLCAFMSRAWIGIAFIYIYFLFVAIDDVGFPGSVTRAYSC
jgi:hypothetical protein